MSDQLLEKGPGRHITDRITPNPQVPEAMPTVRPEGTCLLTLMSWGPDQGLAAPCTVSRRSWCPCVDPCVTIFSIEDGASLTAPLCL